MIYGYCVRLGDDPPPAAGTVGIADGPVRVHGCGDLGVWVSEVQVAPEPSVESLRQHDRVVREALRSATPLPLRFGSVFRSGGELEQAIEARRDAFRHTLDRVAGLAEMVIRVEQSGTDEPSETAMPPEPRIPDRLGSAAPGREYLERRRAHLQSREKAIRDGEMLLAELAEELRDLAVEESTKVVCEGSVVGRVACLVRRGEVPAFRQRVVDVLRASRPDLAIHVTGPWAPYSFANE